MIFALIHYIFPELLLCEMLVCTLHEQVCTLGQKPSISIQVMINPQSNKEEWIGTGI